MKTITKLTIAAALAVAASAPAFAKDTMSVHHKDAMTKTQQATDAFASAPVKSPVYDPAAGAVDNY